MEIESIWHHQPHFNYSRANSKFDIHCFKVFASRYIRFFRMILVCHMNQSPNCLLICGHINFGQSNLYVSRACLDPRWSVAEHVTFPRPHTQGSNPKIRCSALFLLRLLLWKSQPSNHVHNTGLSFFIYSLCQELVSDPSEESSFL